MQQADIGLIGLAVMGQNLVLNLNDHGFSVAVYNRTQSKVQEFLAGDAKGRAIFGASSYADLVSMLKPPRRVMLLIKAGRAVDEAIKALIQELDLGDIIIDGGNSYFKDSIRRTAYVESTGLRYIGTGVSGGELGARHGPSIMPGGTVSAWPFVEPLFKAIAARLPDGSVCCEWMGSDGAGHFVKMVHNGIEYAYMQLISETYAVMQDVLHLSADDMAAVFKQWNSGRLSSYLVEITAGILAFKDADGQPLVEKIRDSAGQKGTGRWTAQTALELGIPVTLITDAVYWRLLSALRGERQRASTQLTGPARLETMPSQELITHLEAALYAAEIIAYAQGYMLFSRAAQEFKWSLDFSAIARIWRKGCIIRSALLGVISSAYARIPVPENLMLAPGFREELNEAQLSLRRVVSAAVERGVPVPAFSSALAFYDGYRSPRLATNLLQAQRDYFGAHTYEREDAPDGQFFHTDWTGQGRDVSATSYNA